MLELCGPRHQHHHSPSTPLKKVALPIDVATQIVILSSTVVSGHVTGQILMVEGGMEGQFLDRAFLVPIAHLHPPRSTSQ